jgi:hypothetical protein
MDPHSMDRTPSFQGRFKAGMTTVSARIREADVDLILLEEVYASEAFRNWLAGRVFELPPGCSMHGLWRSAMTGDGESDLLIVLQDPEGRRHAALIENKIDAAFTLDQPERYTVRGQSGVSNGHWEVYRTCLVAPEQYQRGLSGRFDVHITYEEIIDWLRSHPEDPRHIFKAELLSIATKKLGLKTVSRPGLTQEEFLSSLGVRRPAAREALQAFLDWAAERGIEVQWNPASLKAGGTIAPKPFLYCDTDGSFNVHFAALARAHRFSDPQRREMLKSRLNSIGSPIRIDDIDRPFQGFQLDRLTAFQLNLLLSVLDWVVKELGED